MSDAAIIKTNKLLIIHSYSKTDSGLLLASAPYFHLNITDSDNSVITSLFEALEACKTNVAHPKQSEWSRLARTHLSNLRFKSFSQMHKLSIMCEVSEKDSELHFMPSINHIAEKHFSHLPTETVVVSRSAPNDSIIGALNRAFQKCEPELD